MSSQESGRADVPQDAVVDPTATGSEEVAVDVGLDDGEEFMPSFIPTDLAEYDRWEALPSNPVPSEARNILRNTFLDDRDPPRATQPHDARQPTHAQRQQQHRLIEAEIEADRREEENERAVQQTERERAAGEEADKAVRKLNDHRGKQQDLLDAYETCRQCFHQEDPQLAAEFEQHAAYAAVISKENVRFHDYLCYFKRAPHYVTLSLKNLGRSYHEESRLASELNRWERAEGSQVERLSAVQQEAAAGAAIGIDGYGLDTDPDIHFTTIDLFVLRLFASESAEEQYIRAIFERRRVRLEHETSPEMRWPQVYPFESSLDNSVREFIRSLRSHYIDENGQPRRAMSQTLANTLAEMQTYATNIA